MIVFEKLIYHLFQVVYIRCPLCVRLGTEDIMVKEMALLLKSFIDKLNLCSVFPGTYIFMSVLKYYLLRRLFLFSNAPLYIWLYDYSICKLDKTHI